MDKSQYIKYRKEGNVMAILYEAAVSGGFRYSMAEFTKWFSMWTQINPLVKWDSAIENMLQKIDASHNLTLVQTTETPPKLINII